MNLAQKDNTLRMCALAAIVMAFGWGYRGVTGHEGGAMVPGAMLGLAVCLASQRLDWHRRAAVAGLFAAVGWSWGGSLSYMEHTLFAVTDSWPDVLFGYAMLFFLGALWAGIGGATLGLAFTLKRSRLEQFARVFTTVCASFLTIYLYFQFNEAARTGYELFTADNFHDGEWLAAIIVPMAACTHLLARRADRHAAFVFLWCALGWWIGYLTLTKFGGLVLAPPFRSESWGGVLGLLIALMIYLVFAKNRAAMLLCRYGILGGGLGFMFAVFLRHPIRIAWEPIAPIADQLPQWKIAEELFGLFMGVALALGVSRLERHGLAAVHEDRPRKPLDIYAVFVMLIALMWVNLRRAPMDWIHRYKVIANEPTLGIMPWLWFVAGGIVITAVALYALYLYARNELSIAPRTAYGKGALVLILLLWLSAIGGFIQHFPSNHRGGHMLVDASFVFLCALGSLLLLKSRPAHEPLGAHVSPSDPLWRPAAGHAIAWACAIVSIFAVSGISMAMQEGPAEGARLRFGENAYWRQQLAMVGAWKTIGLADSEQGEPVASESVDIASIEFRPNRSVILTTKNGEVDATSHRWFYMNSRTHIEWNANVADANHETLPLNLYKHRVYVPWPPQSPTGQFLVLEKK
ncbi:MAG TPA: hypothetical protein PLJ47_05010 [Candidatus Hydrogenedentes bacterium]|nr:hypothetical protein [Candidatus Hydrogenedentota bacterium]HRK33937.1 hypothetical protein [Candidatus Hydrogenedentota bacterium]